MKPRVSRSSALALLIFIPRLAAPAPANPALTGFPFTDEALNYTIDWPSGLNLGEGHLQSKHTEAGWSFEMTLDASVPGYAVKDSYTAHANADFCSTDFARQFLHGARKGGETETIDRSHETVTRVTANGGGTSESAVPDCIKDALTLLFYTRRELGQGRVPPAQQILFGGLYQISLDYTGAPMIKVADKQVQSDEIVCNLKGPSSNLQFEMYFARDPARTPLLVIVPLGPARFSMELVR
ncbi:MAG: DUF3108 domain-containing protein [Bryobacteraceae bacterium]|jgi:hypothetical protein